MSLADLITIEFRKNEKQRRKEIREKKKQMEHDELKNIDENNVSTDPSISTSTTTTTDIQTSSSLPTTTITITDTNTNPTIIDIDNDSNEIDSQLKLKKDPNEDLLYHCHWCKQGFVDLQECQRHQTKIHRYSCVHCEQKISFLTDEELKQHQAKSHPHIINKYSLKEPKKESNEDPLSNKTSHFLVMGKNGEIHMTSQAHLKRARARAGEHMFHELSRKLDTKNTESDPNIIDVRELNKERPYVTSRSFTRRKAWQNRKINKWSKEETEKFYKYLSQCGMDFILMSALFKDSSRSARDLKAKYKRESKTNPLRIQSTLATAQLSSNLANEITEQIEKEEAQKREKQMQEEKIKPEGFDPMEYLSDSETGQKSIQKQEPQQDIPNNIQ